jgi:5-methyltetrahydrofolate--homocysteine methyltransferase
MIELKSISRGETVRYLGGAGVKMNSSMESLLDSCESELLKAAVPKYLYKKISVAQDGIFEGEDVRRHLSGCEYAYAVCVTLGAAVDRLIRSSQVSDMAKAVVIDAMASAAVENAAAQVDGLIADENAGKFLTWRFSPGYGDYPLSVQDRLLSILDAPRKIGLCVNSNSLLTPTKSVTAVLGVSQNPIPKGRRGCAVCNLAKDCKFRKAGTRCEF